MAQEERNAKKRANRKTKITPSQAARDRMRAKNPADNVGEFYDKNSYRKAIEHAIRKGNKTLPAEQLIKKWTPYQLRHAAATEAEQMWGLDEAQAQLGHTSANMTKRYSSAQLKQRENLARERRNPFATADAERRTA